MKKDQKQDQKPHIKQTNGYDKPFLFVMVRLCKIETLKISTYI